MNYPLGVWPFGGSGKRRSAALQTRAVYFGSSAWIWRKAAHGVAGALRRCIRTAIALGLLAAVCYSALVAEAGGGNEGEGRGGKTKQIIFSVKAGKVTVSHIRDLVGVISREKAEIGAFLSLEPPTSPMCREAASAGFYKSPWGRHPRIQLLTIEDLLGGKSIDYPQAADVTFKKAQRVRSNPSEQKTLPMEGDPPE